MKLGLKAMNVTLTWTCTLCGRRGTYGTGLELVTRWGAAGLRLGAARFLWQAWHFLTWTVNLRGRRGTYGTGLEPCDFLRVLL